MIVINCDRCKDITNAQIRIMVKQGEILIECLECGDAKRFRNEEALTELEKKK